MRNCLSKYLTFEIAFRCLLFLGLIFLWGSYCKVSAQIYAGTVVIEEGQTRAAYIRPGVKISSVSADKKIAVATNTGDSVKLLGIKRGHTTMIVSGQIKPTEVSVSPENISVPVTTQFEYSYRVFVVPKADLFKVSAVEMEDSLTICVGEKRPYRFLYGQTTDPSSRSSDPSIANVKYTYSRSGDYLIDALKPGEVTISVEGTDKFGKNPLSLRGSRKVIVNIKVTVVPSSLDGIPELALSLLKDKLAEAQLLKSRFQSDYLGKVSYLATPDHAITQADIDRHFSYYGGGRDLVGDLQEYVTAQQRVIEQARSGSMSKERARDVSISHVSDVIRQVWNIYWYEPEFWMPMLEQDVILREKRQAAAARQTAIDDFSADLGKDTPKYVEAMVNYDKNVSVQREKFFRTVALKFRDYQSHLIEGRKGAIREIARWEQLASAAGGRTTIGRREAGPYLHGLADDYHCTNVIRGIRSDWLWDGKKYGLDTGFGDYEWAKKFPYPDVQVLTKKNFDLVFGLADIDRTEMPGILSNCMTVYTPSFDSIRAEEQKQAANDCRLSKRETDTGIVDPGKPEPGAEVFSPVPIKRNP